MNERKNIPQQLEQLIPKGAGTKPEIRWWLAGGSHTDTTLLESLEDIRAMGFGGIEVLTMAESAMDREKFGWDSQQWYRSTKLLLEKCNEYGMAFSFTSGPNWQPAVPEIDLDGDEAAQELNFNAFTVPAGAEVHGALQPYDLGQDSADAAPRKQHFFRAVAVRLAERSEHAEITLGEARHPGLFPMPGSEFETVYLDGNSAVDVTAQVHPVGEAQFLRWTAPKDGTYVVFSFWYHATAQQAMASYASAYVINHIYPAGFEAQKRYWEKHFFTPELCRLIRENGSVNFFQDSLEINTSQYSGLYWSPDFMEEFRKRRRYDLTLLLPMVIQYNIGFLTNWITKEAQTPRFLFEGWEEKRQKLIRDVYQTQTELYMDNYLTPIRQWLNGYGIKLRAQTSYGFPTVNFEVSEPISCVDIHETETLEMADEVDYFRTQSGGVHLTGKNVYSAETGATNGSSYYLTPQHYLCKIHKLFAGGVNRLILHGYAAKAGPEGAVQWPGYEALFFDTSERWGSRHPYGGDMKLLTGYLGRMQRLLQTGTPKLDVGILNLAYTSVNMDFWYGAQQDYENHLDEVFAWADRCLNDAGYTYEFFAPQYLEREDIPCADGLYDAGRTDYRALIVNQAFLPEKSSECLLRLAQRGMPVVLLKSAGMETAFLADSEQRQAEIRNMLLALPNVREVENQAAAVQALEALGVFPRSALMPAAPLMQLRRESGDIAIQYLYNPTYNKIETTVELEGTVTPWQYDSWSETCQSMAATVTGGKTCVHLTIPPQTAQVILTLRGVPEQTEAVQWSSVNLTTAPWKLRAELWTPGEKRIRRQLVDGLEKDEIFFETHKTEVQLTLPELKAWKDIPELGPEASGIGWYETEFQLPEDWDEKPLAVDFGTIAGIISGAVNGMQMAPMNLSRPVCEITELVHPGVNQLQVKVSTTLCNQLIAQGRIKPGATVLKEVHTELSDYGLTSVNFYTNA